MPDLAASLQTAKQAGYTDKQIADHLADDPGMGAQIASARKYGYSDGEIVSHLSSGPATPAPTPGPQAAPPKENVFQRAGRLTAQEYQSADQAYRADATTVQAKMAPGKAPSLMDAARPVLDAVRAGLSPVKGVMDATFGEKPVALPFGINSKGMTPGDMVTFAVPVAGELNALRSVGKAADAAGVTSRTMQGTLDASKGAASSALAAKGSQAPPSANPSALASVVGKFDKAGVRPSLAAAQGEGSGASKWANTIGENALAGGPARTNMAGQVHDVQASAKRIGSAYGQAADRTATGEAVQQGVKDFNQRFSDRAEALYDPVFAKIGTAQEIASQQAKSAAALHNAQGAGTIVAQPVIQPTATADVLAQINGRGQSPALQQLFSTPQVQKLTEAVKDPGALNFGDLRAARTWVREAQKDDSLRQGVSQADLQRLEGSLTQDINTNAANIAGPKVARQLQQADQFYRLGSQRIQGALQAFVGKGDGATAESAYDRVIRAAGNTGGADSARLAALKKSLQPSEWGDVAASVVNRMGAPTKGAANANDPEAFSLANFVSNYAGMSDRGKAMLFGGGEKGQNLKAELDNLVDVAGMVKGVEKGANASKSGVSMQNAGTLTTLGGAATAAAMGHVAPLAVELGGLGAMNITGRILTDPKAVRWLANLGRAQAAGPQATAKAVARLGVASRTSPALVPLYQESAKLLPPPTGKAAASDTSPPQ